MSRTSCRSKQALLRGLRPNSNAAMKNLCGVCPSRCIYCDIWKLATLVASHVPRSSSPSSSSSSSHRLSRRSSGSSDESFDYERSEKAIEAQFQAQRARLASIMSICTVDGADECEGLRMAHDRCLGTVHELMRREQLLDERHAASNSCPCSSPSHRQYRQQQQLQQEQQQQQSCGVVTTNSGYYYADQKRPSLVGLAM